MQTPCLQYRRHLPTRKRIKYEKKYKRKKNINETNDIIIEIEMRFNSWKNDTVLRNINLIHDWHSSKIQKI